MATPPTIRDVLAARRVVREHVAPTPLHAWPLLSRRLGIDVLVKHENHQPVGAFKVRGGIYLLSRLSEAERRRGVVCASTGNHGQSIAFAASRFGVRAVVVVPEGANPGKVESMRALGAEVQERGSDFVASCRAAEALSESDGLRFVHSGNEPDLIAGVGTYALEIVEACPDVDTVIVPVGGGSGASGCCTVLKSVDPAIEIIACGAEGAPAAQRSWREGRRITAPITTFAEGVATGEPFELPQSILRRHLDDFVLVSDDEIRDAIRLYLETTRNLAEGAGAIPLAAARKLAPRLKGRRVALVLSGGNLAMERLRDVLAPAADPARGAPEDRRVPGTSQRSEDCR